ncbi:hypothetical protein [Epibacterium sp. Ofav1-8]|uniref:hypothetical protein n=1 Tax=Epibacterium sp. Ofav1-8 TaxID=2917735 RepID=UPI001EF67297|nr:hypothetical protein [Epibacterium sp. Ofav1-8]MCG7622123.1 hypothetical protein [Epibacterium sp. Ofav1-8]
MYETRRTPPISRGRFLRRMGCHVGAAAALVVGSITAGALFLMHLEQIALSEALLHAATLVSGLGLVQMPGTMQAQVFVSLFALYSGFVALAVSGLIVAPVAHRLLHWFHWEDAAEQDRSGPDATTDD